MRARGVDVSSVQDDAAPGHVLRWDLLAAGDAAGPFDFGIFKATQGATGRDPFFTANINGARASGVLAAAAYHVVTTTTAVADQAKNALDAIAAYDVPIAVDFEVPPPEQWLPPWTGEVLVERAYECCSLLRAAGAKVVVYSYPYFLASLPRTPTLDRLVAEFDWWYASYGDQRHEPQPPAWPKMPPAWQRIGKSPRFWQWSGDGGLPAPGVPCVVDHNLFDGDRPALERWLAGTKSEAAPTDPAPSGPAA